MIGRFARLLCAALLIAAAARDAAAADPKRAESYLADAARSLQSNDLKSAAIQLRNAVQSDPENAKARYELGVVLLQLGELNAAEAQLRAALARRYDGDKVAAPLAETMVRLERNQELLVAIDELAAADADITAIFAANPQDPLGNYLQALAHAKRQNFRAAELSLQKMKGGLFTYPPAMYLLAVVNLSQNQLAQAEESI